MNTMTASIDLPRLVATAILGVLALSLTGVSAADDRADVRNMTVKFGDLNVADPRGAAALYSRILWAAHEVCDRSDDVFPESRAYAKACVSKAVADAVTKVGHPQLIAVYNAKNRQPLPVTVAAAQTR